MNDIQDINSYNARMNKSMLDKAFFLDKVDANTFIDFGCGDGSLLNFINEYLEDITLLVGYDNNPSMIDIAERTKNQNILFYHQWKDVVKVIKDNPNSALILSSVIHEVYSYSTPQQINEFWFNAFSSGAKYIIIRDMMPNKYIARPSDMNDVAKVYKKYLHTQELTDFENIWGSIEDNKNLIHFLLKYRYMEPNWQREVRENYLPLYREDLLALLDVDKYQILYHEHYPLPYIKQIVLEDFNIELKDPTHIKLILRRL